MGDVYNRLKEKGVSITFLYRKYVEINGNTLSQRSFHRYLSGEREEPKEFKIMEFLNEYGYLELIKEDCKCNYPLIRSGYCGICEKELKEWKI